MNSSELLEFMTELKKRYREAINNHEYEFAEKISKEISVAGQGYGEMVLEESKEEAKPKVQNLREREMEAIRAEMDRQRISTAIIQQYIHDGYRRTTVDGKVVFDSREEERKAIRGIFQNYESAPVKMNMKNAEDSAIEKITKSLQSPGCEICCPVCHPDIGSLDPSARHSHSSISNCWHFCKNKYSQDGQKYWLDRMLSHVTLDFPEKWGYGWGNVPPRVVDDSTAALAFLWNEPQMDVTTAMARLHRSWRERHNPKPVKNTRSGVKEWIKEPISTATPIRFALSVGLLFTVVALACLGFGALIALLIAVL